VTENEFFLSRWARLKQEAARQPVEPEGEPASAQQNTPAPALGGPAETSCPPAEPKETAPEFDPARLPPLESIDATTDVSAFLARGVPAELTAAALRRAWAADPAIRDFVGLAENAWDFTAPQGVPGFGPLRPGEVIPQVLADIRQKDLGLATEPNASSTTAVRQKSDVPRSRSEPDVDSAQTAGGNTPQGNAHEVVKSADGAAGMSTLSSASRGEEVANKNKDVAAQDANNSAEFPAGSRRRAHGGALPD